MDFRTLSNDERLAGPWELAPRQGQESTTWLSDEWALQLRQQQLLKNMEKAISLLQPISHLPAFRSADAEIIKETDISFYVLAPRISGKPIELPRSGVFHDQARFEKALPSLSAALHELHELRDCSEGYFYPRNTVVASALAASSWIRSGLAQKLGKSVLLPSEPGSDFVISHGDFAPRNILARENEVVLFDWPNICSLPRHSDAAYMVQSILCQLPEEDWLEILQKTHVLAPYLNWSGWVGAVVWSLARSAAVWSSRFSSREGFLSRLPGSLDDIL